MKRRTLLWLFCLPLLSCRTAQLQSQLSEVRSPNGLSAEANALWEQHVQDETAGKKIQPACMPRFYPANPDVPRRGMLMFFHGFTACPQQYFAISERLSAQGFDIFLPLMPGQGREPFDGPQGVKDNFYDLPTGKDFPRYQKFVDSMNTLASKVPGPRVISGLSGGAALATGAAIYGQGIWDRILVYSPYYKNPGIQGPASAVLDVFVPGFVNDWGPDCRVNRKRQGGRQGLCALKVDSIRAMTDYGLQVVRRMAEIKIPMQFAAVEADPTADDGEIYRAKQKVANSHLCFYPKGVPHSLISPATDTPEIAPYWVPSMQDDSITFITDGTWFREDGVSVEYKQPRCLSK